MHLACAQKLFSLLLLTECHIAWVNGFKGTMKFGFSVGWGLLPCLKDDLGVVMMQFKLTQLMKPLGRCIFEEVKVMDLKSADLLVGCCNVCTRNE